MSTIDVSKTIRTPWSTSGYKEIVRGVLGSDYSLSIVLIGNAKARTLNKTYRNKDTPANILTFPLNKDFGEIFLNIAKVKTEAKKFDLTPSGYAKFLLIHGCLHLLGYSHGSTMEKAEKRLLSKYSIR